MARYSLGSLDFMYFHALSGRREGPQILTEAKSVMARPGTNGVSVRKDGKKGIPFQMKSTRDTESFDDAEAEFSLYKTAEDDEPAVGLKWENITYESEHSVKYLILNVTDKEIQAVSGIVAPAVKITTTPTHLLMAVWTLVPVEA